MRVFVAVGKRRIAEIASSLAAGEVVGLQQTKSPRSPTWCNKTWWAVPGLSNSSERSHAIKPHIVYRYGIDIAYCWAWVLLHRDRA